MDLGLKGKKAIVTGGTRGIGLAIVSLLADEGCDVALCARSPGPVEETVAALMAKGVAATGGAVDVADLAAAARLGRRIGREARWDRHLVANNSALAQGMDENSWRRGFEIDVMGTVFGIEAALPVLEKSSAGSIVVVGGTALARFTGRTVPTPRSRRRSCRTSKGWRAISPPRMSAPTWSRLAMSTSRAGMEHRRGAQSGHVRRDAGAQPTGRMGTPEEWRTRSSFWRARGPALSRTNLIIDGALTQRVQF